MLAKLGAIGATTDTAYGGDLLRYDILISDTKVLLIHEDFLERITPLQDELSWVDTLLFYIPSGKKLQGKIKFPTISFAWAKGGFRSTE